MLEVLKEYLVWPLVYIGVFGAIIAGGLSMFKGTTEPEVNPLTGNYIRNNDYENERSYTSGDYDCSDFDSQSEAQDFFEDEGASSDYHNLDADGDGIACETI